MQAGDTFLLADRAVDDHLWVILSDPSKNPDRVLIVSLTTAAEHKERVCLIQAGEHPWVRHETCVAYDKAKAVALRQLNDLKLKSLLLPQAPLPTALLQRIRNRAGDSVDLPLELAELLLEQGLVEF